MRILNIEYDISFARYGIQFADIGAGHTFMNPGMSCACYYTPFVSGRIPNAYEFILQLDCPYHGPWHVEVESMGIFCWNKPPQLKMPISFEISRLSHAAPSAIKLPVAPTEMK